MDKGRRYGQKYGINEARMHRIYIKYLEYVPLPVHQGATGVCLYLLLRKEEDYLDSDYQAEGVTGRMVVIEVPAAFNSHSGISLHP